MKQARCLLFIFFVFSFSDRSFAGEYIYKIKTALLLMSDHLVQQIPLISYYMSDLTLENKLTFLANMCLYTLHLVNPDEPNNLVDQQPAMQEMTLLFDIFPLLSDIITEYSPALTSSQ